jgi:hypothetical protein
VIFAIAGKTPDRKEDVLEDSAEFVIAPDDLSPGHGNIWLCSNPSSAHQGSSIHFEDDDSIKSGRPPAACG